MKNPANPGEFGTNGTRGVVGSDMSETTNSAEFPIGVSVSVTQTCGKPASEFEMLTYAWYALGAKMRADEGGVGYFTPTRSGNVGTASEAQTSRAVGECGCERCQSLRLGLPGLSKPGWRYACERCGNKRCPHHEWHGFDCTDSNEPGQIGVERSAKCETTNSPAEIGTGCTGREMARLAGQCAALVLSFAPICFIALWIDRKEGLLCAVISVTISAAVSWCLWPPVVVRRRGSGGDGD